MRFGKFHRTAAMQRGALVSVFIVLGAVALLAFYLRPATGQSSAATVSQLAAAQAQVLESAEQQRRAVALTQLRFVLDTSDEVLAVVDCIAGELDLWESETKPLLHNKEGRLIAADFDRAKSFSALLRIKKPTPDHLDRQRARINELIAPLRDAVAGKHAVFKPDEAIDAQLGRERKLAQSCLAVLRDSRKGVEALLVEARQHGDEPAAETLEETLSEVEEHFASLRTTELARVREVAEKDNRERLAELEKRKLTELGIAERDRREAELEAQRVGEETQARLVREKAERERLMALAGSPEIQARYQVFLAKGRYSFEQNKMRNTTAFAPSYNALRKLRITHDPKTFATAAGGYSMRITSGVYSGQYCQFNKNDRPLWSSYPRTDAEWEELGKRFKEFQELAPIWRDTGVLRP